MAASALMCWYFEKTYSVQSLNTIVEPKKRYGEFYQDGDLVKAKFKGVCYPALLVKIDDDRETLIAEGKRLEKLLSEHFGDILPEEIMAKIKKIESDVPRANLSQTSSFRSSNHDSAIMRPNNSNSSATVRPPKSTSKDDSILRANASQTSSVRPSQSLNPDSAIVRPNNSKSSTTVRPPKSTSNDDSILRANASQTSSVRPSQSLNPDSAIVRPNNSKSSTTVRPPKSTSNDDSILWANASQTSSTSRPSSNDQTIVRTNTSPTGTCNQEQLIIEAPSNQNHMRDLSPIKSRDKRIRLLEDEVKDLKSELRSTRKRLKRLEEKFEEKVSNTGPSHSPSNSTGNSGSKVNDVTESAALSDTSLLHSVSHLSPSSEKETQEIVKRLTLQVFARTDLIECSRTGKKSAKTQDDKHPRPALDSNKMLVLERAVLGKCPQLTRTLFFKKFENLQKMERRSNKKTSN